MGMSPQEVASTVARDEVWVMQYAAQTGKNPAAIIYEMALNTGYSGGQTRKMETLQKGVKVAQSLGSGGAANNKVTLDQLAAMSQDDFDAYCNSNGGMAKVMAQASR